MMSKVNFVGGTQALYNAIVSKDPNSLYFIADTQRIYKGDVDFTQSVFPVVNFPADGVEGKIYIHVNTLETRVYANGAWAVVMPGFIQTVESLEDAANGGKLATIDALKGYVDGVIAAVTDKLIKEVGFKAETGRVFVKTKDDTFYKTELTGVAHDPVYDTSNLTITIPQYGKDDLVINLPHDTFLTDAFYKKDYDFEDGTVGPAIVLVVKTEGSSENKEIAIPASSMVNDYKAASTSNVKVAISDDHTIKAKVLIDSATSDGVLMIWDAAGQKIGTVGVKVNNNTAADMGDSNEFVPTAAVVAAAIRKACEEITGGLLAEGNANEVVLSTEHGIVRSGMIIGGATLSNSPNAQTLATEAAVLDAISWKTLA